MDNAQLYYKVFKYKESAPDELYSFVGATRGNEKYYQATKFYTDRINTDIQGRGFYAEGFSEVCVGIDELGKPILGIDEDETEDDIIARTALWAERRKEPGFKYGVFKILATPVDIAKIPEEIFVDPMAAGILVDNVQILEKVADV